MSDDDALVLDPDEPHTPGWLTFLGLGLFLLAGIFFLLSSGDEESSTPGLDPSAAAAEGDDPAPEN